MNYLGKIVAATFIPFDCTNKSKPLWIVGKVTRIHSSRGIRDSCFLEMKETNVSPYAYVPRGWVWTGFISNRPETIKAAIKKAKEKSAREAGK